MSAIVICFIYGSIVTGFKKKWKPYMHLFLHYWDNIILSQIQVKIILFSIKKHNFSPKSTKISIFFEKSEDNQYNRSEFF